MRLSSTLFLFTFVLPLLLWSQPPLKNLDNKPISKKETTSIYSKKKKTVKKNDTKKQDYYVELWRISLETKPCSSGECLLVKKRDLREYEIFEGNIEGFIYTKDNTYTIQVKIYPEKRSEGITTYRYVLDNIIATSDVRYQKK
jgi:hypothetical protein